jgi:hypothetical protein
VHKPRQRARQDNSQAAAPAPPRQHLQVLDFAGFQNLPKKQAFQWKPHGSRLWRFPQPSFHMIVHISWVALHLFNSINDLAANVQNRLKLKLVCTGCA